VIVPARPRVNTADRLTRDEKLELCVRSISHSEGVPPFARHAEELIARSRDLEGAASNLVQVILKDVGLTAHILRVANSTMYNRSGRPIISIVHAITMLGWDTVRDLVEALQFVEHYARTSPGLRELMMFSVLTAAHGRQVAALVGYSHPENAYICGLFRNLGEIVLARYYGRQYAEVLQMMREDGCSQGIAASCVFGFTMDDLSRRLAVAWNLPDLVRVALDERLSASSADERCLASVTAYAHELTTALYRRGAPFETVHLRTVTDATGCALLIAQRDLRCAVDCAVEDTRHTFSALQIPVAALSLERHAEQARKILELASSTSVDDDVSELEAAVLNGVRQVETPGFDVTQVIQEGLDALTRSGGFERAVFALMSDDRTWVRGRLGSGECSEEITRQFRFSLLGTDPAIRASVDRGADLWIDRRVDSRYEGSLLVRAFDPSHFVLLPIIVDGVVAGLLYADRQTRQVPEQLRSIVDQMRHAMAAAIAKKRMES
jgi:HD-like signal output (HDOD) protein